MRNELKNLLAETDRLEEEIEQGRKLDSIAWEWYELDDDEIDLRRRECDFIYQLEEKFDRGRLSQKEQDLLCKRISLRDIIN